MGRSSVKNPPSRRRKKTKFARTMRRVWQEKRRRLEKQKQIEALERQTTAIVTLKQKKSECRTYSDNKSNNQGMFAVSFIPQGSRMGPYDGLENVHVSQGYGWKIRDGKLVDTSRIAYSHWMRFVNCATDVREQNLATFQHNGFLYFKTLREICPGDELLVIYEEVKVEEMDGEKFCIPPYEEVNEELDSETNRLWTVIFTDDSENVSQSNEMRTATSAEDSTLDSKAELQIEMKVEIESGYEKIDSTPELSDRKFESVFIKEEENDLQPEA